MLHVWSQIELKARNGESTAEVRAFEHSDIISLSLPVQAKAQGLSNQTLVISNGYAYTYNATTEKKG
jgi:hypothetical protein